MSDFTHFNHSGNPHMVDISAKQTTHRKAVAKGRVTMSAETLAMIKDGGHKKGDVLGIAQLAGIMGAKHTSALIPLCHPLALSHVGVDISLAKDGVEITAECRIDGQTGVEMEALTAVSIAALTIYDMCKSVDRGMVISTIRLVHKSGGKSGAFDADEIRGV